MLNTHAARIVTIFIISISIHIVHAGQEPAPVFSGPSLSGILLLDAARSTNTRILAGERGYVFVSRDGQFWETRKLSTDATLTAVYLHDDDHGWAVGHDAVIFRTDNGGEDWQKVYSAPEAESPLLDVWFKDQDTGIAVGAYGLYLTTSNGGKSWTRKKMQVVTAPGNENRETAGSITEEYDLHLNAITSSINGKLYIAAEAGHLYRSDDLGESWAKLPSPYKGSFFGVLTLPDDSLLVFGLRGHLYHSDDAGNTWTSIDSGTSEMLTNGLVISDRKVVLVGMGGTILLSDDLGRSFTGVDTGSRNGFSAILENNSSEYLVTGDHGLKKYTARQLGVAHE